MSKIIKVSDEIWRLLKIRAEELHGISLSKVIELTIEENIKLNEAKNGK